MYQALVCRDLELAVAVVVMKGKIVKTGEIVLGSRVVGMNMTLGVTKSGVAVGTVTMTTEAGTEMASGATALMAIDDEVAEQNGTKTAATDRTTEELPRPMAETEVPPVATLTDGEEHRGAAAAPLLRPQTKVTSTPGERHGSRRPRPKQSRNRGETLGMPTAQGVNLGNLCGTGGSTSTTRVPTTRTTTMTRSRWAADNALQRS